MANWMRTSTLMLGLAIVLNAMAAAQEPADNQNTAGTTVTTSSGGSSAVHYTSTKPVPELKFHQFQNRFQMQQRMMRLEYNKWIGYEPLRPTVSADPYSQSSAPVYHWTPYGIRPYYPTPFGAAYRW